MIWGLRVLIWGLEGEVWGTKNLSVLADTCRSMVSPLTWDDSMSHLYSGKEEREKFAQKRVLPLLKEIEKKIEKKKIKRNLKSQYFKCLLEREERDGFLIIECMAHLRKNFREVEGMKVLSMILNEWKGQTEFENSYDTLRSELEFRNVDPIYICNALILQARRLRGLTGIKPKNAKAARKLVVEAGEIWNRNYGPNLGEGRLEFPEEDFCLVPNRLYKTVIDVQQIFCDARFGDMSKVEKNARGMIAELSDEDVDWGGDHRPNLILKWWMFQVMLRSSAVCMDLDIWKEGRKGMEDIEGDKKLPAPVHSYLSDIKGRSQLFSLSISDQNVPYNDLKKMRVLLSAWNKFRQIDLDVLKFRRRGGDKKDGDKKLRDTQGDFTDSLKDFNKYLLMGAKSGFVSHSYTRDEKQSKRRARKILVEISEGRRYVTLSETNHSCFQLEILHRLLIYRIWWESVGKPFELFLSEDPAYGPELDAHGPVNLSLNIPIKILQDIEFELNKIHIHRTASARWRKEIRKSIKVFSDGGENLTDELRKRIAGFDLSFRREKWPEGQADILGLPYNDNEGGLSPYEVMDPTMRHVGVNTEGAGLEQRTESQ